jgi:hypothetical protein
VCREPDGDDALRLPPSTLDRFVSISSGTGLRGRFREPGPSGGEGRLREEETEPRSVDEDCTSGRYCERWRSVSMPSS